MADDTKAKEAAAVAEKAGIEAAEKQIKAGEAPKTVEEANFHALYYKGLADNLGGKLKEVTDESIKRKEKIRAIEKEKEDKEAERLTAEGKFKELVDQYKPKAERADALEAALKGYFDLEIADVPEEKRSLIPAGPVETQLTWLKQAKSQGLFGEPKKKPDGSDHKKQGDPNAPEFLSWAPTDKRLETLSTEDYERWKKHNGRDGSNRSGSPSGWGGGR